MARIQHPGVLIMAVVTVVFGLGEVVVGLTGNYLGILDKPMQPSLATAVVGGFYMLAGPFLLMRRRWGLDVGIACIAAEILGRVYLVAVGIGPGGGRDLVKVVIGGLIALGFIAYLVSARKTLPA